MPQIPEAVKNPLQTNGAPKILIIDDDLALAKTMAGILNRAGYETEFVLKGADGVENARAKGSARDLNIVLSDIRLPDMSGLDVLREIKRVDPDIGVIVMTGHADVETSIEALNAGAFAYIQKPYNPTEVKSTIEKILDKQTLMRENKILLKKLQDWNSQLERKVQEKTAELSKKNLELLGMVERLEELNMSKSQFVANASHELQTPMTSIIGFSSMLLDYGKTLKEEEFKKFLTIIRDETQRLARLSADLLDLSRIKDGRITLKLKKTDLKALAEKVRESMKVIKPGVNIEVDFGDGALSAVTDQDKIHQVMTNLAGNALKYAPESSAVRIEARKDQDHIQISVKDEGPGIPEGEQEKIFEPFYRVQNNANLKIKGTGLGLSIAKAIVEALGGRIAASRNKDKGSCFMFTVPLDAVETKG